MCTTDRAALHWDGLTFAHAHDGGGGQCWLQLNPLHESIMTTSETLLYLLTAQRKHQHINTPHEHRTTTPRKGSGWAPHAPISQGFCDDHAIDGNLAPQGGAPTHAR